MLKLHREKWQEDTAAEARAKEAAAITDKEAALLKVYRTTGVRDQEGHIIVRGVRVGAYRDRDYSDLPKYGAFVTVALTVRLVGESDSRQKLERNGLERQEAKYLVQASSEADRERWKQIGEELATKYDINTSN